MVLKLKQYKNLILLSAAFLFVVLIIVSDPLGLLARRRYERSVIQNRTAVEKAEAERAIAVIQAQAEADLLKIRKGLPVQEASFILAPETEETE